MTDRYRVWADIEAADEYDAERKLRQALDGGAPAAGAAIAYRATGRETYNGWTNYETWAVNLWLTNEQHTAERLTELARQALADSNDRSDVLESVGADRDNTARHTFAEFVKEWVDEMMPDLGGTLAADLLGAAMSEVDWYEIATNHIDEARENG